MGKLLLAVLCAATMAPTMGGDMQKPNANKGPTMAINPSPATAGENVTFSHSGPYPVKINIEWSPPGPTPTQITITGPGGYTMVCPSADSVTLWDPAAGGAPPVSSAIQ